MLTDKNFDQIKGLTDQNCLLLVGIMDGPVRLDYIVIYISPVTNIGHKLLILLHISGQKFRPYILRKFKIGNYFG